MRNFSILLLVLLIACKSNQTNQTADSTLSTDSTAIDRVGDNFPIDSISETEYNTAPFEGLPEAYSSTVIDDTTRVFADSLKIVFKLNNGTDSVLTNNTNEDDDGYKVYNYVNSCADMEYWLIFIGYYEGSEYLLVDKEDGRKIYIWGPPVVSPDKKCFITYSSDIEAGFTYNGIQLFEIINRKAVLKWQKEINTWGPDEVRWKDNNTLYIKKYSIDYSNSHSVQKYNFGAVKISELK